MYFPDKRAKIEKFDHRDAMFAVLWYFLGFQSRQRVLTVFCKEMLSIHLYQVSKKKASDWKLFSDFILRVLSGQFQN